MAAVAAARHLKPYGQNACERGTPGRQVRFASSRPTPQISNLKMGAHRQVLVRPPWLLVCDVDRASADVVSSTTTCQSVGGLLRDISRNFFETYKVVLQSARNDDVAPKLLRVAVSARMLTCRGLFSDLRVGRVRGSGRKTSSVPALLRR